MKDLQASQVAQTAELRTNNATVANQLVAELRSCPIPAQPVYTIPFVEEVLFNRFVVP